MYIGPWQEYRLAKIQDDAIQRLRKEWEDQLREQIPEGDDVRSVFYSLNLNRVLLYEYVSYGENHGLMLSIAS